MEDLNKWGDTKLITEAESLHESIYNIGCYGTRDMRILEMCLTELNRRGYVFDETKTLIITKKVGHA